MKSKLVSAIITTYKRRSKMLDKAVQSVLMQTYDNMELLIVDDNKNNNPLCAELRQYVDSLKNQKVRYIKQKGNKGACAARNLGMECAKGDYFAFLDDDDLWEPEKIEKQVKLFQNDSIGMVFCKGVEINDNTNPPKIYDYYSTKTFKSEVNFDDMINWDYIGTTSQAIITRKCWEKVGGFYEKLPARQDYEMWIRISLDFRILGVPEPLFQYIQHGEEQITKSFWKAFQGNRLLYKKHKNDRSNCSFKRDFLDAIYWRFKDKDGWYKYYFFVLLMIQQIRLKIFHPEVFA
ncbi:MAG: glycosyltransferase family 2 protein [Anaerostipes sp.]|jgi:glycosyltransferase involved in cell wall biosynthesis|nr:glycosyltransferase family 2 protein [Anaerostipes sp.]MDD3745932.1 glycosyltransferase family 2 protein [Anaerostipes sp.]